LIPITLTTVSKAVYTVATTPITCSPDQVVFCWDIHDTLLQKEKGERFKMGIKTMWHMIRSKEARTIFNTFYGKHGACAGEYIEHEYHTCAQKYLMQKNEALQQGRKKLAKKYGKKASRFLKLADLFHNFELRYKSKNGVMQMLDTLKAHGYTQHYVASNIGTKHYQLIKKKFPLLFNDTMVQDGLVVDAWEAPICKKPMHTYFTRLHTMFNPNNDKILVFIDDKLENVKAAQGCNMIGIHMKSIKQLTQELEKIGIESS